MQNPERFLFIALICVCWLAGSTASALDSDDESTLQFVSLPQNSANSAGFKVSVSCENLASFGDIPVVVQVIADGSAFTADRSIVVRLSAQAGTYQPPNHQCDYELPLRLPQGQSRVTKSFYLPKWSIGGDLEVTVLEDRRPLQDYRDRLRSGMFYDNQAQARWWESATQRFAWITLNGDDKPDARVFFATIAPELLNVYDLTTVGSGFEAADVWREFRAVPIDSLPQDWRGFDTADVWVIEAPTLQKLASKPAPSAVALKNYIRCGGTLWVLGEDAAKSIELLWDKAALKISPDKTILETAVNEALTPHNYNSSLASLYQTAASPRSYIREYVRDRAGRVQSGGSSAPASFEAIFNANRLWVEDLDLAGTVKPPAVNDFIVNNIAMGRVIAYQSANAIPGTPQQWRAMADLTASEASETLRRAVDPCFGDRRFWDWIIPGVAQPPIYPFIGLLLVFVIVVGPLAYRKFSLLGRGYLMMFVAPLLALFTTLTMFAYGLLADGLSTRERARVITWIGDGSGTAARYSRTTYFAGIRPADGLRFPANVSLLPYQLPSVEDWYEASQYDASTMGTIRLDDDALRLDSSFLPSRQQKQFVTYRPVDNVGSVRLDAGNATAPKLHSDLSFEVRQGILRDQHGKYFLFERLPPGTSITPDLANKPDASKKLSDLYGIQRPIAPAAVSSARRAGETTIDLISLLAQNAFIRQSSAARVSTGESWVEDWLRTQMQITSELPPGMFVAIADVPEDCIAVPSAELVESVHYVIGVLL